MFCWWALLALLLGSAPAMGNPVAFARGDSSAVNPGVEYDLRKNSVAESVFLFIEFGSLTSTEACVPGAAGDEVCGFDATIEIQGDVFIVDFVAAPNVKFFPATFDSNSRALHAVGLTAVNPEIGPRPIGELVLDTTGTTGGKVIVTGVAAVRADLESFPIDFQEVATTDLPEPDSILILLAGIITLVVLRALRSGGGSYSPARIG